MNDFLAMRRLMLLLAVSAATDAPIVGVLTVPSGKECGTVLQGQLQTAAGSGSCFGSLYVKYIEAAGGRVVPILYDASDEALIRVFNSVNAVLFTGGGLHIADARGDPDTAQYLHAASLLFNLTVAAGDKGVHVPLWGTCLGLQTLSVVAAGEGSVLETNAFDSENMSLPLELTDAARESRLLGVDSTPPRILRWLTTENITSNLHHDGVSPETFAANARLGSFFTVLSTNRDRKGRPFVSTIEGRRHAVYGVQWHPERPIFEWDSDEGGINHGAHAIESMQFFANFFIAEARKNQHRFPSAAEEEAALIYNYVPQGRTSYQGYMFPPAAHLERAAEARAKRPLIEQQVTWLYARSLTRASQFVAVVMGLELVLEQGPCNIYRAAPEHFLGVCDSRPPPQSTPPVTYTIVVSRREGVDEWHSFLAAQGNGTVLVTSPSHSDRFNVYAFNFYDPDPELSLGFYRFEVQTFEGRWPQPTCPPVASSVQAEVMPEIISERVI